MLIGTPVGKSKTQYFINQAYVDYVHNAGLEALQISPRNDINRMVNLCDGLLLPGGIDIDPVYYDEDNLSSYQVDPEKDAFERHLFHEFVAAGKPIFGICRGLQLIAYELMLSTNSGSRLRFAQHIEDHSLANDLSLGRNIRSHSVLANMNVLYGKEGEQNKRIRIYVNSMHHQCLLYDSAKNVDNGDLQDVEFEIVAYTSIGINKKQKHVVAVEAFRIRLGASRILAVQWHPEELEDIHLLSNFFRNANEAENAG